MGRFLDTGSERRAGGVLNTIKKAREAVGLSQSQLAAAAEISVRMLQEYEQGRKRIDKAEAGKVLRIAKALGTTVEELLQ